MFFKFSGYLVKYIFKGKNKQRLLLLAVTGLFLSAFSLQVLQSVMSGLQGNVIRRAKDVQGDALLYLNNENLEVALEIKKYLKKLNIFSSIEYEIELLMRNGAYLSPVILHGIDIDSKIPSFFGDIAINDLIVPIDLSHKLRMSIGDKVRLITPSYTDPLMGDIPRSTTVFVDDMIRTNVGEIDLYHSWVRLSLVQNLIRSKAANRIRIYSKKNLEPVKKYLEKRYGDDLVFRKWERENKTLVMALKLEEVVMKFLFISMSLLVSLCIVSGLMIFLSKIKGDLASLWILGASKGKLERLNLIFINLLSFFVVILGVLFATGFLWFMDHYGMEIMPNIFVDRKIPMGITYTTTIVSIFVPYLIAAVFSFYSLNQFKRETSFLKYVRTID